METEWEHQASIRLSIIAIKQDTQGREHYQNSSKAVTFVYINLLHTIKT